jgi:hypothetical protein
MVPQRPKLYMTTVRTTTSKCVAPGATRTRRRKSKYHGERDLPAGAADLQPPRATLRPRAHHVRFRGEVACANRP